ncbi:hypothetical protein H0H87_002808, partial [Tephrocybe sp. NHM501043]
DIFRGTTLHTSEYVGGHPFKGKRAIVIGAGNSSADICQDLVVQGAESVTMVQRSSTCVISSKTNAETMGRAWPEREPPEVSDFKVASCPLAFLQAMLKQFERESWEREKDLHEGLIKAGLKLNMGPDGSGLAPLVSSRAGGKYLLCRFKGDIVCQTPHSNIAAHSPTVAGIDVGCADLISAGKIKIKQGVEVERFSEDSVAFNDGSVLDADVVIFATGYFGIRDSMKETFGDETIERTSQVWNLDEEGELRGSFRPTGHPGLWYAVGGFYHSRFSSKQLALEIKAVELGLVQF